jgi:hypothetical protein
MRVSSLKVRRYVKRCRRLTREAVRIREADAAGAGAVPLPAGGIKTSQWKFEQKKCPAPYF